MSVPAGSRAAQGVDASRGMLWLALASALYVASGYVLTVWLARELAPAAFGQYAVVVGIVTVLNILVSRGVPVAASRAIAERGGDAAAVMRQAWRAAALVAFGVGVVGLVAALPLSVLFDDRELRVPLLVGAAAAVTYAVFAMSFAAHVGAQRYVRQAVVQVVYAVVRPVAIVAGAVLGGVAGAVAGFVLAPLAASLAALGRRRGGGGSGARSAPAVRELVRSAVPLVAGATIVTLLLSVDLLAFKRVGNAVDIGRYGAAATIGHVPFFLLASATFVLLPGVAAARDAAQRQQVVRRGLGDAVTMLALPTALLVALGDRALPLIFGASYELDGAVVAPLAIATAAITLHSLALAVESGLGSPRVSVLLGLAGVVAVAIAATLGGTGSDAAGAASATALATSALALVHLYYLRELVGSFFDRRWVLTPAFAVVLAAACAALPPRGELLVASVLLSSAVYVFVVIRTGMLQLRRDVRSTGNTAPLIEPVEP